MFNTAVEPQAMHRDWAGVIISQSRQRLASFRGTRLTFDVCMLHPSNPSTVVFG
jgi:hypothetical protein